jgi:hypothetical protein
MIALCTTPISHLHGVYFIILAYVVLSPPFRKGKCGPECVRGRCADGWCEHGYDPCDGCGGVWDNRPRCILNPLQEDETVTMTGGITDMR